MRRILGLAAVLAAGMLVLIAAPAQASQVHCADVITQDTTLDTDLIGCPGDGLVVAAPGITINLKGHTISGTGTGWGIDNHIPPPPDDFLGPGYAGVTIENGTIRGFGSESYS